MSLSRRSPTPSRRSPTGGFSTEAASSRGVRARRPSGSSSCSWSLAGANFALLYRAVRPRGSRGRSCATRSSGSTSTLLAARLASSSPRALDRGHRRGRGGDPPRGLPGRLDDDDDRLRERRLQRVDAARARRRSSRSCSSAARPARPAGSVKVVRHLLLGRILRRELDQTVHPELVTPVRLNGVAVDERTLRAILALRPALRRRLRARRRSSSSSTPRASDVDLTRPRRDRGVGDDARQRRAGVRLRRPDGLVRPVQRLLEAGDDPPHVARPAGDHPRRRAAQPPLLADLTRPVRTRRVSDTRGVSKRLGLSRECRRSAG